MNEKAKCPCRHAGATHHISVEVCSACGTPLNITGVLFELERHAFASCDCQSAAEHVRWVEAKLKELREAVNAGA
jgi:hypothetical protein